MRILDESQIFHIGDIVELNEPTDDCQSGEVGCVESVISQSNYYEHRPIACYVSYRYVVRFSEEKKLYLPASKLIPFVKNRAKTLII